MCNIINAKDTALQLYRTVAFDIRKMLVTNSYIDNWLAPVVISGISTSIRCRNDRQVANSIAVDIRQFTVVLLTQIDWWRTRKKTLTFKYQVQFPSPAPVVERASIITVASCKPAQPCVHQDLINAEVTDTPLKPAAIAHKILYTPNVKRPITKHSLPICVKLTNIPR